MRPYGTSSADGELDAVLRSEPPVDGATLNGWVALAEWAVPGGEPMLVLTSIIHSDSGMKLPVSA